MTQQSPVDQPSRIATLLDRVSDGVRRSLLLRMVLVLSVANYAGAALFALAGRLPWALAGVLTALSLLTWYFGLGVPLLNREVHERLGSQRFRYWGEVVEMFGRVVLVAHAILFTGMLAMLAS